MGAFLVEFVIGLVIGLIFDPWKLSKKRNK